MTAFIRNWLLGVTCVSMALALAKALVQESSVKKVLRLAGGLVLIIAVISPLKGWSDSDVSGWLAEYRGSVEEYKSDLESQQEILYGGFIEEETEAYILDKAEQLGITCQVKVTVSCAEDGTYTPEQVIVTGNWTAQQKAELQDVLESDLGIPLSMQYFEENDP